MNYINAQAIAEVMLSRAAPELLAALREIVAATASQDHGHPALVTWTLIDDARAAIAKATGAAS